MRRVFLWVVACLLLVGVNAFAGDGDMIINGKLGVGTTSPVSKLHVVSSDTPGLEVRAEHTSNWAGFSMKAGASTPAYIYQNTNAGDMLFQTGGAIRMSINNNGNVGIGTTNPVYAQLQVNGDSIRLIPVSDNANGALVVSNAANTTGTYIWRGNNNVGYIQSMSDGTGILALNTGGGNVGIGTTSPAYKLDVNGVARINGTVYSSDIRWKKNITPLENSLDQVMRLQGVSYDWRREEFKEKHFEEGRQIGFIAQEVEKVIPEMVKTDSEGYKAVSYEKITAVLVEAMKEQQKNIENQQKQIEELRSELKRMKARN